MMIMSSLNRIGPAVEYPLNWTAAGFRSHEPVLQQCIGVAAVDRHHMSGVLPVLERPPLRAGRPEVDAERKYPAVLDGCGRLRDLLRSDEVQGAELVVVAPPPSPPVTDVIGNPTEIAHTVHAGHPPLS